MLKLISTVKLASTVKVYRDVEWEQFIVKPFADGHALPEATWYYTDDKADAVATANAIAIH